MGTDRQVEVEGRELKLTNLDKVLYPKAGFTKGEVVDYYAKVAPAMVPHLAGRAVTLRRFPEGVEDLDAAFFEKRCPKHRPKWVKTASVRAGPHAGKIDFCVCDGLPTLIWMAQLAAIELHPSLSLSRAPTRPTVLAFDLDPGPPADIVDCCRVAIRLRDLFGHFERRVLPQDLGLEGDAGLRAAQLAEDQLRRDQTVRQSDRPAAREADPRPGRLEDEEGRTRGQGLRRLVAEPPQQDDDRRLLACERASGRPPRPRSPGRRSRRSPTRATARPSSSRPPRCWRGSSATATSSPRCWSCSRLLPEL